MGVIIITSLLVNWGPWPLGCYDYASANLARTPLSSVVQYSGYYINKKYVLDLL